MWLIDYAQSHQNKVISVVSETYPHLKRGVIRDFLVIMAEQGYIKDDSWNKTDSTYTFETGSIIEFFSADQPGKVRGPRRDVLFINEGNNIEYEIYTQLEVRTREIVWVDSNPTHEYWIYTEVMPHNSIDFLTLTYRDNEGLEQSIIDAIESRKSNKNWYKVYALGQLGEIETRVYTGWDILEAIPQRARLVSRGLDFGYSNDPAAIVDIYKFDQGFILDEQLYKRGCSNKELAFKLLALEEPDLLVHADSAEPKSIDELGTYEVNIAAAQKGPGSVNQGIQYVQGCYIMVTKRSTNLIKEYRNYLWQTDKDGKILNKPEDVNNHLMDALRYGLETYVYSRGPQSKFVAMGAPVTSPPMAPYGTGNGNGAIPALDIGAIFRNQEQRTWKDI
jgi:phage terminase large subunit